MTTAEGRRTGTTSPLRFQFSLRTLNFLMLYVALVVGWLRWTWSTTEYPSLWLYYPGKYGLLGITVGIYAYVRLARGAADFEIWNLLVISFLFTAFNTVHSLYLQFEISSWNKFGPSADEIREGIRFSIVSAVTIPSIVAVPAIDRLLFQDGFRPSKFTRWFLFTLVVAILNVALLAWFLSSVYVIADGIGPRRSPVRPKSSRKIHFLRHFASCDGALRLE